MDPPPPSLRRDPAAAGRMDANKSPEITTEAQRTRRQKYNPQISQITQITTGDSHATPVEDMIRTAVSFRSCRPAEVRNPNLRDLCNLRIYLRFLRVLCVSVVNFAAGEGLVDRAGVASGEKVLIHGGAGAIAQVAVQLAKAFGAGVYSTVRRRLLVFFCRSFCSVARLIPILRASIDLRIRTPIIICSLDFHRDAEHSEMMKLIFESLADTFDCQIIPQSVRINHDEHSGRQLARNAIGSAPLPLHIVPG
jgi:hypothetical protein